MLKWISRPLRRYFNARFGVVHDSVVSGQARTDQHFTLTFERLDGVEHLVRGMTNQVDEVRRGTELQRDEALDATSLLGHSVDALAVKVDDLAQATSRTDALDAVTGRLDELARQLGAGTFDPSSQGQLHQLQAYEAQVANYTNAHNGWASQAGLWFNAPLSIAHAAGGVSLSDVNERIAEVPFVYESLAGLSRGSRILDVGSTESTVTLSLASLGHRVTAVDPRPYPLNHSRLETFQGPVEDFASDEPFDAAVLLSSVEHFGLGAYELPVDEDADLKALAHVWGLCRPGARLVLTTPFGDAPTTALERTYTPDRLARLLDGWDIEEQSYLTRISPIEWVWSESVEDLTLDHVVLVRAARRAER